MRQGFVNREGFIDSEKLLKNPKELEIRETLPLEEEYIPVRDQGFRRAVVTAYAHRCALCGIRVRTLDGHTAVTAAHIVPWSETEDDRPVDRIALCRMCHWTFDEGLLGISQRFEVITSEQLIVLDNLPGYLTGLEGRGIVGPGTRTTLARYRVPALASRKGVSSVMLYPAFRLRLLARKNAPGEDVTFGTGTLASNSTSRKLSI